VRAYAGTAYQNNAFSLADVPLPVPGPGEVRLQIRATALGFVDGLMVQGLYQIRPPLPYVPGGEIAGFIDAAGPEVAGSLIGRRVATWQLGGGLGEYVVVPANGADFIPDALPFETAAAMLVDYQTAYYALFHRAKLKAGETILVLGAAGAVSSAAVQLALQTGAYVIAAASTDEKRQVALDLGAHASVDYGLENWRDVLKSVAPGGAVDVVFDPVGGPAFEPAFRSLRKDGRHLVIGFTAGKIPCLPANLALLKSASLVGVDIRHFLASQPEVAQRNRSSLFELVATGKLKAPKLITYPLEQAAQAIDATMARAKTGKVVVLP
jgi:NADPH2:quinone reductase